MAKFGEGDSRWIVAVRVNCTWPTPYPTYTFASANYLILLLNLSPPSPLTMCDGGLHHALAWLQDLKDGTNVGDWHWTERDVMAWSRSRLGELLAGTCLADTAAASARVTGVEELKG